MKRVILLSSIVAVVFGCLAATAAADDGDTCCFTNPHYTGVCRVTTGPDETCADVLAYLNNQASTGKTYCGNTKVRGGWAQVDCEGASGACAPPPSTGTDPESETAARGDSR